MAAKKLKAKGQTNSVENVLHFATKQPKEGNVQKARGGDEPFEGRLSLPKRIPPIACILSSGALQLGGLWGSVKLTPPAPSSLKTSNRSGLARDSKEEKGEDVFTCLW